MNAGSGIFRYMPGLSWSVEIPRLGDVFCLRSNNDHFRWRSHVCPKYDLIWEEDGELKITVVEANDQSEAQMLADCANATLKGIVYSDKNIDPTVNA